MSNINQGNQIISFKYQHNTDELNQVFHNTLLPGIYYGGSLTKTQSIINNNKGYLVGGDTGSVSDLVDAYDITNDTWTPVAVVPTAKSLLSNFQIGSKGFVAGGIKSGGIVLTDVEQYNVNLNTWSSKQAMPTAKRSHAGFTINSEGYAIAGTSAFTYKYNYNTDSWETKAAYNDAWEGCAGFQVNSKGYLAGGVNGGAITNTIYEYSTSLDSWTAKTSFEFDNSRHHIGAFTSTTKGYICGGKNNNTSTYFDLTDEFDPVLNSWSSKQAFTNAKQAPSGFNTYSDGMIAGGKDASVYYNTSQLYTILSDTWTSKNTFTTGRTYSTSFSIFELDQYEDSNYISVSSFDAVFNAGTHQSVLVHNSGVLNILDEVSESSPYLNATYTYSPTTQSDPLFTVSNLPISDGDTGLTFGAATFDINGVVNGFDYLTRTNPPYAVDDNTLRVYNARISGNTEIGAFIINGNGNSSIPILQNEPISTYEMSTKNYLFSKASGRRNCKNITSGVTLFYSGLINQIDIIEAQDNTFFSNANSIEDICLMLPEEQAGLRLEVINSSDYNKIHIKTFCESGIIKHVNTESSGVIEITLPNKGDYVQVSCVDNYTWDCNYYISTKGYASNGTTGSDSAVLEEYNNINNIWFNKTSNTTARVWPAGFSVTGKGFIAAGQVSGPTNKDLVDCFIPSRNAWISKSVLPEASAQGAAFTCNLKNYYCKGSTAAATTVQFDDLKNVWTSKNTFTFFRFGASAFSCNNIGYILGGSSSAGTYTNRIESYNSIANAWSENIGTLTQARRYSAAFFVMQKGVISGGYNGSQVATTDMFNKNTNACSAGIVISSSREQLSAFSIGTKGYVTGGSTGSASNIVQEFSINSLSWASKTSLTTARYGLTSFCITY